MDEPILIVVDNRVRLPSARLADGDQELLKDLFTHRNPNKQDKDGPAFYRTWRVEGADLALPRGGMSRVREFLRSRDMAFRVVDRRVEGDRSFLDDDWGGAPIPVHDITLRDWQAEAVELLLAKQNCILRAPTASGKTTAGLSLFSRMNLSTLVIVPTRGLIDLWVERLAKEMGLRPRQIGVIGGGKHRTSPITVATQGALAVGIRDEWKKSFGAIIYDEVQKSAAPTCFAAVDPWPAKYRLGISANETRHDKKEFLIYDLFGDVAAKIEEEDVIAADQKVEVEIRMVPTGYTANWYKETVASGNQWRIRAGYRKLIDHMWPDPERNELIRSFVVREVERGHQVMVLSNRREHCTLLDQSFTGSIGSQCGIMLGGAESRAQFDVTAAGVRDGSISVVTGTIAAIGVGIDFPSLTAGFVVMPIHNNKQLVEQVKGRFARVCEEIGKTRGILYYAWDRNVFGRRPLENMCKWNKLVKVLDGDEWVDGKEHLEKSGRIMGRRRPSMGTGPLSVDDMVGGRS